MMKVRQHPSRRNVQMSPHTRLCLGSLIVVALVLSGANAGNLSAQGRTFQVATEPELQNAMRQLASNTTIVLAPGTYRLTRTLYVNGAFSNVVIRGVTTNRDEVILQGPGMRNATYGEVPSGIWTGGGVQGITIAHLTIRDFYFHAVMFNPGTQRPSVANVRLLDAGEQLIKSNPSGSTGVNDGIVESSVLEYTSEARDTYTNGVDVHAGQNWIIRNNVFRNITSSAGLAGPAVLMWNGSGNTLTERNLFVNCARGIHYGLVDRQGVDHSGGVIRNNIFFRSASQPGDVGIGVFDSPGTQVLNNTVFVSGTYPTPIEYRFAEASSVELTNNLLDGVIGRRDGASGTERNTHARATAGMFLNAAAGDLHLAAGSAAIDRGLNLPSVSDDWDGDARPQGMATDIGADEYRSGGAGVGSPTHAQVSVSASAITVSWAPPGSGAAPTAYRLDFRSGNAIVASLLIGGTIITLSIPSGTRGTFSLTVTAIAGSVEGPPSAAVAFTIESGCAGPPLAPSNLSGRITSGVATVNWHPSPDAASYILQAGSMAGLSDPFNANLGSTTAVSAAGLPTGFRAFVRVIAVGACGQPSAPTTDVLVQ